jgi:5-deoxy-glucuronate isomerase
LENTFIKAKKNIEKGYRPICEIDDVYDALMDFGLLALNKGDTYTDNEPLERAFLLISGTAQITYGDDDTTVSRKSCFDENPYVLHVPQNITVTITGGEGGCELSVHRTENDAAFRPRLFLPSECVSEHRGEGTMNETSTRIVRTVFDKTNAPYSNMVLGEVVGFPGKWSSYPPHFHRQPEIYHYRTLPENGYGYCDLGDEVLKVQNNDTVVISKGQIHPHVTAPGYALWYLWVIRHLDDEPYIAPTFVEEHAWVMDKNASFWTSST